MSFTYPITTSNSLTADEQLRTQSALQNYLQELYNLLFVVSMISSRRGAYTLVAEAFFEDVSRVSTISPSELAGSFQSSLADLMPDIGWTVAAPVLSITDSPSPAPTQIGQVFSVDGPCGLDGLKCITSPAYPSPYSNNEFCTITINQAGYVTATFFSTEEFDFLSVAQAPYSGTKRFTDVEVVYGDDINWASDSSLTGRGWRVCWDVSPSTLAPTTSAPTIQPTPAPTAPTVATIETAINTTTPLNASEIAKAEDSCEAKLKLEYPDLIIDCSMAATRSSSSVCSPKCPYKMRVTVTARTSEQLSAITVAQPLPTDSPSVAPSDTPTAVPTGAPNTFGPTNAGETFAPSGAPTPPGPSSTPSWIPSGAPSAVPSSATLPPVTTNSKFDTFFKKSIESALPTNAIAVGQTRVSVVTASPTSAPTWPNTSTPPPTQLGQKFSVNGPCVLDGLMCVASPGYPSPYSHNELCTITVVDAGYVNATEFHTEKTWDTLTLAGNTWSGAVFPPTTQVSIDEQITWESDYSDSQQGWRLCWTDTAPASGTPCAFNTSTTCSQLSGEQCRALCDFYFSTGGAGWTDNTGWGNGGDPCLWKGLACIDGNTIWLEIVANNLIGELPNSLSTLSQLRAIILSANDGLFGTISNSLVTLSSLQGVGLAKTKVSGSIPAWQTSDLIRVIALFSTKLSGTLSSFQDFSNLELMSVSDSSVSGTVPSLGAGLLGLGVFLTSVSGVLPEVAALTKLRNLQLWSTEVSGVVPDSIVNVTSLKQLYFSNSSISGSLPTVRLLTLLQDMQFYDTSISGSLPILPQQMESIYAYKSKLSGTLPPISSTRRFSGYSLQDVLLHGSHVSGVMPDAYALVTSLRRVYFSSTKLSGTTPSFISKSSSIADFFSMLTFVSGDGISLPILLSNFCTTSLSHLVDLALLF